MSGVRVASVKSIIGMIAGSILTVAVAGAQQPGPVFVPFSVQLMNGALVGDDKSQTSLGIAYLQANGTQRDAVQAVRWFEEAYKQGNADAAAWLGSAYLSGQGVSLNIQKGLALIKESEADGSAVGLRFTAAVTEKGIGQAPNITRALQLYQIAAIHLDPVACDRMGMVYQNGVYRSQDLTHAAALYSQAANAGYSWAQLHLGELYASNAVFNDPRGNRSKGSAPWLSEAYAMYVLSGTAGNRVGAFRAAQALSRGLGTDQDPAAAQLWFRRATRQNYGPAQEGLAALYAQHPELGHSKIDQYILLKQAVANNQQSAAATLNDLKTSLSPDELRIANSHVWSNTR